MCLIIYSGKGQNKNDAFLEEAIRKAEEFNGDGIGYAIKRAEDNSVFLNKGFFDIDHFIETIKEENISDQDELMVHLRIGNKGKVNIPMCHPFLVSSDQKEILNTHKAKVDKPIMAHNGTMYKHAVHNSDLSDTYYFTKNVLSKKPVLNFLKEDPTVFDEVMQPHLNASRLIVMFPSEENTVLLGKWYIEKGLYFSKNYSVEYFPKVTNYSTKGNWNNQSNLWDDVESFYRGKDYYDDIDFGEDFSISDTIPSIIPETNVESVYRFSILDNLGYKWTEYMGLLLPEHNAIRKYIPIVDENNIDLIDISAKTTNYQFSVYLSEKYRVLAADSDSFLIENLTNSYDIEVPKSDFYESFNINLTNIGQDFYGDYFKLVKKLPASKTLYNKLCRIHDKAVEKNEEAVNYKDLKYINLDALSLFIDNIKEELEIRKNPARLVF